ncbi:MAG: LysR family transcriptional regulator [Pseudomonadota bacterium]
MTIDGLPIRALRVAVAIADRGSFAAAGRHLNLPRAAISRIIGQLEDRTGARLFRRNTRKVVATDAGEHLIAAARRALAEIDGALEPTSAQNTALTGQVRLSVSHAFGRHFVLPAVGRFRAEHPGVLVEMLLQDRLDDMITEDIDFTIRLGPLPESDLVVRRLGAFRSGLAAAPALLALLGETLNRGTLGSAPAIGFRVPGTGQILPWPVPADGQVTHAIKPNAVAQSDSIEAVLDMTKDGQGIALLPKYLIAKDVDTGCLLPVCPDLVSVQTDVHICFRERRFMPARVRALIDYVAADISSALASGDQ